MVFNSTERQASEKVFNDPTSGSNNQTSDNNLNLKTLSEIAFSVVSEVHKIQKSDEFVSWKL